MTATRKPQIDMDVILALACSEITTNYSRAAELFFLARLYGSDMGMYNLGLMYHAGIGVKENLSIARYFYTEALKNFNIENVKFNKAQEKLNVIRKSTQNNNQVFIDFMTEGPFFSLSAEVKINKWNAKFTNLSYVLDGTDLLYEHYQFQSDQICKLRIYIHAHCWTASDYLFFADRKRNKVHYNALADALATYIGKHEATINLLACCASKGLSKNSEDSFAAKLHLALYKKLNRDTPIIARESLSALNVALKKRVTLKLSELEKYQFDDQSESSNNPPKTQDINYYLPHQPHSKFIFMFHQGKQIKRDAYEQKEHDHAYQSMAHRRSTT